MRRFLLAAALLIAGLFPAMAQVCPTVSPFTTSDNRCASTQFVQNAIGGIPATIVVGSTPITGGTSGRVLYDNAGVLGEYPITGTGSVVLGTSPTIATPAISSPTLSGTVVGNNTIPLSILQQSAANTMLGNWTGSAANVLANAMPSCPDTGANHLNYVSGTGITCGTGIGNGITALTGDVTATGPGSVAATLATAQPGAHTWAAAQTINMNSSSLPTAISGTGLLIGAANSTVARVQLDSFGTISAFTGAVYAGTAAAPTQVLSGTQLTGVNAYAYTGSALVGPLVSFRTYAAENITATAWGTKACIATTPSTTATLTDGLCQQNSGGITIGSPTGGDKGVGTLNSAGTIYINGTALSTSGALTVGTTTIASGTTTRILYDNAGVLGEYTLTGSGTVVAMQTAPTFVTNITAPVANLSGTSNQLVFQSAGVTGTISWAPASTNKTITLPNGTTDFTATGGTGQVLRQSSTGAAITVATLACSDLSNGATGCSTATGTSGATIPLLNGTNTWSGTQTFTNSSIKLLGSSTGATTFTSANSGASNFTLTFPAITSTVSTTIASGAKALATSAISSAACTSAQTDTATGTLTTDAVSASFAADPTAVTGYVPLTTGMLTIILYPTADTVNFKVCNNTASSITPGAITINWRVVR